MLRLKILHNDKIIVEHIFQSNEVYYIGRSSDNDIILDDKTISRKHLKIFKDKNKWQVELVSEVGLLYLDTQPIIEHIILENVRLLVPPYHLIFELIDSKSENDTELMTNTGSTLDADIIEENYDDATAAGVELGNPYLRIQYKDGMEEFLELKGNQWILGRGEEATIPLRDQRSSRNHILIFKKGLKYYVRDLGSSNGTLFNGKRLIENKDKNCLSGDSIQIGSTHIRFEIRDPNFESKISNLPALSNSPYSSNMGVNISEVLQSRSVTNKTSQNKVGFPLAEKIPYWNTLDPKRKRFYMIVITCLVVFLALMTGKSPDQTQQIVNNSTEKSFNSLAEEEQLFIRNSYEVAYQFYVQDQYDLALGEIKKIHEIIPDGYIDPESKDRSSKQLEAFILQGMEMKQEKARVEQDRKEREKLTAKIEKIIAHCDQMATASVSPESAQNCLSFVLEQEPDNPKALAIIQRLEEFQQQRELAAAEKRNFNSRVNSGEALYNAAVNFEKQKKYIEALQAYQKHIDSSFPDPNNLKAKSTENKNKLNSKIKRRIQNLVIKARAAFQNDNYPEAVKHLNEALYLDPSDPNARTAIEEVRAKMTETLQRLYSDSVFAEDQNNVEEAINIWKKILITDEKGGEYYKKAKVKLRKYGR